MARSVTILGAGLVGSLLAIILRKRGYEVVIYERRPDMRKAAIGAAAPSINLAMSARGWKALDLAGLRHGYGSPCHTYVRPLPAPGRWQRRLSAIRQEQRGHLLRKPWRTEQKTNDTCRTAGRNPTF